MIDTSTSGPEPNVCVTCGERLQGRYCHACGEKRPAEGDRTVRHFVGDVLGSALSIDGTFWRTFRLLVFRPGALTAEHIAGRRRPYLTPLRLFLLCNVAYFVAQPYTGFSGYNTPLRSQMSQQAYSRSSDIRGHIADRLGFDARIDADELAESEAFRFYEQRFDARSDALARTLVILLIPLTALLLKALLPRRLLADHLVFATHLMAWQLLVVMSAWLLLYGSVLQGALLYLPLPRGLLVHINETHALWFVLIYLFLALRRAYGLTRGTAAWRSGVLALPPVYGIGVAGLLVIGMVFYRYLLFWITFWTVGAG